MGENKNNQECSINGICSVNAAVSSLHEVVLLHIKHLAFYLLKLSDAGITNDEIRLRITDILYSICINVSYSQQEFNEIITTIDKYISQSVYLYEKNTKEQNIKPEKPFKKLKKCSNIVDAIKDGEKNFLKKYKQLSEEQHNVYELVYLLCKSIIIRLVELQRLGADYKDAYYTVLSILNSCELDEFCFDNIKDKFDEGLEIYFELIQRIFSTQKELYGEIRQTEIDMSSFAGKAVLVSGSDLKALQTILEITENTNINIYTHGFDMLVAHTLEKFSEYKNLKGHFSVNKNNYIADFSTFRGPILMSRVYMENADYLYRGRLFSQDSYVSKGVEKIKNGDFEPLITATEKTNGFKKYNKRKSVTAGFNEKEILDFTDKILEKLINDEVKRLYVIGICNCVQNESYYDELLSILPENSFAFSFSYDKSADNIYHINSLYDGRLFLKIFRNIEKYKDKNISVFMTQGDRYTVANLLLVKKLGFKHVFSDRFPDSIIAPHNRQILQTKFGINFVTTPREDLAKTMC